jgi:HEAT repeat protein
MPFYGCAPSGLSLARARYRTLIVSAFYMACALLSCVGRAAAQSVAASSGTRLEAVMASIRARDPQAVPALTAQFAGEPQPSIRAWIVRGVAALGAPQGPALFQSALQDSSPLVRMAAVEALAKSSGAGAVPDLTALLAAENNAGVRHAAAAALGSIKTPASAAALQQALGEDADPNVRIQAARSLRRHGAAGKRAAKGARNDQDPRVRAVANEP